MTEGVHVEIFGRVQGVGYRAWTAREADRLGLAGWVRNRRSGTVEAVFSGSAGSVDEMLAALLRGPPGAAVERVERLAPIAVEGTAFEVRATG